MRNYSRLLTPSHTKDGYEYARVFNGNNGYEIAEAKMFGWELVTGDDPEDPEHKAADGTRQLGDTVLMRIKKERREELKAYKREVEDRLSGKAEDEQLIERMKSRGAKPFTFQDAAELAEVMTKRGAR